MEEVGRLWQVSWGALTWCPKWLTSEFPKAMETPGTAVKNLDTSLTQAEYPARYLSVSNPGWICNCFCRFNFCKCLTVNSKTSAFSNLVMDSPSDCRAKTIKSFSSSRLWLMRARRFLSSKGFITFLYWWVRDMGASSIGSRPKIGAILVSFEYVYSLGRLVNEWCLSCSSGMARAKSSWSELGRHLAEQSALNLKVARWGTCQVGKPWERCCFQDPTDSKDGIRFKSVTGGHEQGANIYPPLLLLHAD